MQIIYTTIFVYELLFVEHCQEEEEEDIHSGPLCPGG